MHLFYSINCACPGIQLRGESFWRFFLHHMAESKNDTNFVLCVQKGTHKLLKIRR